MTLFKVSCMFILINARFFFIARQYIKSAFVNCFFVLGHCLRLPVSINILVSRRFATSRLVQCHKKHIQTNHYQHKASQVAQIQCGAILMRSLCSKIFKIDTPSLARESEIICTMYMYKYIYGIYSMGILFSMQATIIQKLWAFETTTQKDWLGIGVKNSGGQEGCHIIDPEQDDLDPLSVFCNMSSNPVTDMLHHNLQNWTYTSGYERWVLPCSGWLYKTWGKLMTPVKCVSGLNQI